VQLQGSLGSFEQADIGVAALTYDSPALQQAFVDKFSITYPLLSDIDAASVTALGIRDPEYPPGDSNYGVAFPGVFVIDTKQRVVGKVFIEGYEKRVDAAGVLTYAQEALQR
jgi:peroxiredoxin